jgi:tRNA1(Val) A37 N6-methylase TrmN6
MAIEVDALGEEAHALVAQAEFNSGDVLEIGSGNGRLTWPLAYRARHITAVEPYQPSHERAVDSLPSNLADRVTLRNAAFQDFARSSPPASFDLALLSWALC